MAISLNLLNQPKGSDNDLFISPDQISGRGIRVGRRGAVLILHKILFTNTTRMFDDGESTLMSM